MKKLIIIVLMFAALTSCSKQETPKSEQSKPVAKSYATSQSDFDPATVAQGAKVYTDNCARCHGANGEGNKDWRKRKPDGKLLPPPLNGSGHTWHHPKALLISIISNGTIVQGGEMPAWKDKLSAAEIEAVILWAQSKWPAETYRSWLEVNSR